LPRNKKGPDDAWAWLNNPPPAHPHIAPAPDADAETETDPESQSSWDGNWLITPPPDHHLGRPPARRRGLARRLSLRGWAGLAALAAVSVGVVVGVGSTHETGTRAGRGVLTAVTPATTTPAATSACAGLSGTVVTDHGGDPATVAGVIADFETAYYTQRSADSALRLLAPETGITPQSLAAGIASIPLGTTYCVAITPIAATTADVHIAEMHPDRQRTDYLQLINTRPVPGGLLITNIQKQG
jgi:hypothetical protein